MIRRARRVNASEVSWVRRDAEAEEAEDGTPSPYDDDQTAVRHNSLTMIGFTLLLFPFVLLGFVLLMGRVEEPLTKLAAIERDVETFLDSATPDELDTFVREGPERGLSRFRARLRPGRGRRGLRKARD